MIGLLQRVRSASVTVDGRLVGEIGRGLLVLVGVRPQDDAVRARRLAQRVLGYRVFADAGGRMNRSVRDVGGALLLVPQFTLAADTASGTRPGFSTAAEPARARELFDTFAAIVRETLPDAPTGVFGADMQVALVNDGPVTFWLES
ncbi:MAG: D-tyrosyl-tRNA(Tyr) deacylase [Nevskiaceae bacterium]|nr:MAG: D-tyrosyl-tRNA(Tyr) deacylase [Nevskiaceae bacterium]TBR74270.1 MAG: D-tyrosyl-tRNA(Tyr) deacylase [Nevskiaceae bacterium]